MSTFDLAYNGFNSTLDIPADNHLWFWWTFSPSAIDSIDGIEDYINDLSKALSEHPKLTEHTVIIINGMDCTTDENSTWMKSLNQFASSITFPVIVLTGRLEKQVTNYDPAIGPDVLPDKKFALIRLCQFSHFANLIYDHNVTESKTQFNRDADQDINYTRDKKLYWASTKDIYWRRYILAGLVPYLDDCLVNYKCLDSCIPGDQVEVRSRDLQLIQHVHDECYSIDDRVPLPYLDDEIHFEKTDIRFHLRSFVGLVVETYYESSSVFFSEKLFNVIAYKQIFFYLGGYRSIEYLRKQGYYVFDDIFDLDYDNILNPVERLVAARKSLMQFISRPLDEIKQVYHDHKQQIEHNFKLFRQDHFKEDFTNSIRDYINETTT